LSWELLTPFIYRVRIAGYSGMGKTTLLERLIPELTGRGLKVSLIKHSHKNIEIDRPGKDSFRLREAGCSEVLSPTAHREAETAKAHRG